MSKLFPVQEIGSLAKPKWRTKGLRQRLSSQDLSEAEEWAAKLGIQDFHDRAKSILKTGDDRERVKAILELSTPENTPSTCQNFLMSRNTPTEP